MGKKSGPSAPDPAATAAAQSQANKEAVTESAKVNQINTVSPYGSTSFSGTIGGPDRTQTTTLSPSGQTQLNQQNQVAEGLGNKALQIYDYLPTNQFNYDGVKQVSDNYDANRQAATDKVYGMLTNNTQRDFDRSEETLRAKLASQGLGQNNEAYKRELEAFNDSKNTAFNNASATAYTQGLNEANNAYNTDTQTRNRQIQERLQERQVPANELSAILQGTPAFTNPQTPSQAQYSVNAPDVAGLINNNYQNQVNQANQRASKFGSTVGNIGQAAAVFASDPVLKDSKEPIDINVLERLMVLPVEYWRYTKEASANIVGDNSVKHIGCYADDFQKLFGVGDGTTISVVDIFGVLTQAIKELAAKVENCKCQS
jgi:hypothetical protein